MENQHRKISGYRELSQQEIDLMNRIKAKGGELLELHRELQEILEYARASKFEAANIAQLRGESGTQEEAEYRRFLSADPLRWADIGKSDVQTGIMALVRAIAQPDGV